MAGSFQVAGFNESLSLLAINRLEDASRPPAVKTPTQFLSSTVHLLDNTTTPTLQHLPKKPQQ